MIKATESLPSEIRYAVTMKRFRASVDFAEPIVLHFVFGPRSVWYKLQEYIDSSMARLLRESGGYEKDDWYVSSMVEAPLNREELPRGVRRIG